MITSLTLEYLLYNETYVSCQLLRPPEKKFASGPNELDARKIRIQENKREFCVCQKKTKRHGDLILVEFTHSIKCSMGSTSLY